MHPPPAPAWHAPSWQPKIALLQVCEGYSAKSNLGSCVSPHTEQLGNGMGIILNSILQVICVAWHFLLYPLFKTFQSWRGCKQSEHPAALCPWSAACLMEGQQELQLCRRTDTPSTALLCTSGPSAAPSVHFHCCCIIYCVTVFGFPEVILSVTD